MATEQEIRRNLKAVENAIAQQWLEGLEPSCEVIRDLEYAAQGKLTIDEVITNLSHRAYHVKVRNS